ncbi:hypothetical protein SNOG_15540 [Paecilomyces variotii No. 5]|uniref:FAD binding domain protein n=1 Tax=Byssochlamys spectabilis (strain No. 5 / NBRC 109023) TaxID=1356009 RepID=V5FIR0_BYSSN|nr:hypothetical protein SNOG_15540 [Paecilomyces variotii No. 5]
MPGEGMEHSDPNANSKKKQQSNRPSPFLVDPISGKIFRGLASGIGLAAEAYHHRKEKKATRTQDGDNNQPPTYEESVQEHQSDHDTRSISQNEQDALDEYYSSSIPQQMYEATWQLDEAQDEVGSEKPPPYSVSEEQLPQLAETFLQDHSSAPPPPQGTQGPKLQLPVLITQRRPGKRSRGFVQAYAPLLNDVGIDQATFLDFIDKLNKAVQPSGLIQALNLASIAGLFAPDHFAVLISLVIQIATDIGDEVHSRVKTNGFLDKINTEFFAPRGLVAIIMTWKPSQPEEMITMASFDMNSSITPVMSNGESSGYKKFKQKLAPSRGVPSFEWPDTAPLIFPKLDDLAADGGEVKKQNALKRSSNFVEEYMDRRARAKWAGHNPGSVIANGGPKETFKSIYSDPNHPAASGDPLALLTGGRVQLPSLPLPGRLGSFGGQGNKQRSENGDASSPSIRKAKTGTLPALLSGGLTLLKKDILYLLIVNRPTPQQLEEAAAILRMSQQS